MREKIQLLQSILVYVIFFLVLSFFLPFTQDILVTPKWYLLAFSSLLMFLLSLVSFIGSKSIYWVKKDTDGSIFLLVIAAALSTLFSSQNKVQALLHPMGFGTYVFLFILYFYLSRQKKVSTLIPSLFSVFTILLSLITFITTIGKITSLLRLSPQLLQQVQYFSPLGSLIDSLIFFGFAACMLFGLLYKKQKEGKTSILVSIAFVLSAASAFVVLFTLIKNMKQVILPPFSLSWYAAVETLKRPVTALFGVGIDNFSTLFTKVKDFSYNQSTLWQVPSFAISRSAVLHIITEMGILGIVAFLLLFLRLVRHTFTSTSHSSFSNKLMMIFFVCVFILFPPSFLLLFLFFAWVGLLQIGNSHTEEKQYHMGEIVPIYALLAIFGFVLVGGTGYLLGRALSAELQYKKALSTNNLKDVYEQMRTTTITNPYIERYHVSFAQVNLLIANNVAAKAQPQQGEKGAETKPYQLTEQDRQTISQAIQAGIQEAKNVVALNAEKASNWEFLAAIYRNIINVAQGADTWTVSAYQRAIVLDPQNPAYRLELGGIYFAAKNYDEALRLFEQAIAIKPDWANAQYNFAWASYQKGNYQQAASAMQYTVSLLDPKKDAVDYKKATADLEEFKKKLPKAEDAAAQTTEQGNAQQQNKLSLPTPPVENLEPKIELPKTASPEAK